jgi:hypothetical protein
MKGTVRGSAITIQGMKESPIENFTITDTQIEARSPGEISYAKDWKFNKVTINSANSTELKVQNSSGMRVELIK